MFELLPVHGSFSKPTVTLNILAYSNTSSLLTHLTTFNTIPFNSPIFSFYSFYFLFYFILVFFFFFNAIFRCFLLTLFRYFIKLFYYTLSFPFCKGCRLEKGYIVPVLCYIKKKKKKYTKAKTKSQEMSVILSQSPRCIPFIQL